jgi:hypothetical protein
VHRVEGRKIGEAALEHRRFLLKEGSDQDGNIPAKEPTYPTGMYHDVAERLTFSNARRNLPPNRAETGSKAVSGKGESTDERHGFP